VTTLFDGATEDVLTRTAGRDWFFAHLDGEGGRKWDRIPDLLVGAFADDVDGIPD
jgi:hypothetical protein